MKKDNFEYELPQGYVLAKHLNAASPKLGLILNVVAILVGVGVCVLLYRPIASYSGMLSSEQVMIFSLLGLVIGCILQIAYIVMHELVHGAAYKLLVGEKLTFGLKWSCAFCGVPDIYVYRKAALVALLAPFTVFTLLFGGGLLLFGCLFTALTEVGVAAVFLVLYVATAICFGIHLGGCSGDVYVTLLLMTGALRDQRTLIRDTGPEQFLYVIEKANQNTDREENSPIGFEKENTEE